MKQNKGSIVKRRDEMLFKVPAPLAGTGNHHERGFQSNAARTQRHFLISST